MIFPKFNPNSFWNLRPVCHIAGVRCPVPPLGLMMVAALLPGDSNIRLVDRNAEQLTDRDLDWADIVMTGGMLRQQDDALHLIDLCRSRASRSWSAARTPCRAHRHADFLVLGEAEGLIDRFIEA
jgi:hypothetical protein